MGLPSPAVKPWKPRSTPSAECRIPGPALAPDPGPAPGLVLAPNLQGAAAGGRRGAHDGESVPCRMGAGGQKNRHCADPAGVFVDVPTLKEMPGRHSSTLSFRPRSFSEWKWCRKKTGPSLPYHLVLILQRGKQGPIWSPSEIVLIWDLRPHKRECCPNPTDRRTLGSSPGCVVTWRGHFSLDLSLPCL